MNTREIREMIATVTSTGDMARVLDILEKIADELDRKTDLPLPIPACEGQGHNVGFCETCRRYYD